MYPTRFTVTREGTAAWLRERVLAAPARHMFLIYDEADVLVGHAGVDHADGDTAKLDNVIRGVPGRGPGIMSEAVAGIVSWAADGGLARRLIWLPVFAHNQRAIRFYRRLGFRDDGLHPLTRVEHGGRTEYVPFDPGGAPAPDDHHLRMVVEPWVCAEAWGALYV